MKKFFSEIFTRGFLWAVLIVTFIPPVYFFFLNWLVDDWDPSAPSTTHTVVASILFSFSITLILFIGNTKLISYFESHMAWADQWKRRLLLQGFAQLVFTVLAMTGLSMLFLLLNPQIENPRRQLFQNISIAVIITVIVTLIIEAKGLFQRWKSSLIESERLKKEAALAKYEALKGQLNPHFMFNSLNALSSLIYSDTDKAEEFISEFSNIYRYVLEVRDIQLVKVNKEVAFLESFLFLNKIRFEENLLFTISLPKEILQHYIPSLALQTVVENCIKHNELSSTKPLSIEVFNKGDFLLVKNYLQPRKQDASGTKVGQANLAKRYELLGSEPPQFFKEENFYIAKLPLFTEAL